MPAYTPNATWNNGAAPGISAEALNHLETQYSAALTMAVPLAGGTMSGQLICAKTDHLAVAVIRRDTAGTGNYYIDFQSSVGAEEAYVGYGGSATDFHINNTLGDLVLQPGGGVVKVGSNTVWHAGNAANGSLLTWSAGDYLIHTNATARASTSATYVLLKESTISRGGTIRIAFDLTRSGGGTAYGRIYRNGVAVGTERSTVAGPTTFTEDISGWSAGDLVQVYGHNDGTNTVTIDDLKLSVLYTDMANANASY